LKKTTGVALALGALLIVPASGSAAPTKADTKAASAECHALRAAAGKENFRELVDGAMGKCVSEKAKEEARERRASRRAAREACKEQDLKGKAYSDCVSSTAKENKAKKDAKDEARINAAKECRQAEKDDPDAFGETYGTGKNAFGKCVSSTAKAKHDDE
jgi:hypothetical protein